MDAPAQHIRIVVRRHGGPRRLTPETAPTRPPVEDEVLVRVRAAGVAFGDVLLREGIRRDPAPPVVPGYDVAGIVEAVGPRGPAELLGRSVLAWTRGRGGYSEVLVTPAWTVVPVDADIDPAVAVCLVLNYVTAYQMLHRVARVRRGERILVHGAAGGVGTALLQLAALEGIEVLGAAAPAKHDLVRSLGATPVDSRGDPAVEAARSGGVRAVFDPVGGRTWRRSLQALDGAGVLVAYGFAAATRNGRRRWRLLLPALAASPLISPLSLMQSQRTVAGYRIERLAEQRREWFREDLGALVALLAAGDLAPVVHRTFPLVQAPAAHELLGSGSLTGKVVLVP